jgi:hypothetical protein
MNSLIPDNTTASDANAEIAALKNQVFTLLVALIVVSGTLTVYLYRQVSLSNKDIAQAQQVSLLVAKNDGAVVAFANQLAAYGQKHPDFESLLKKYGIPPTGIPVTAPAAPNK